MNGNITVLGQEVALKSERANRIEYWRMLKLLRNEYNNLLDINNGQFDFDDFDKYVERNHGIKIIYVDGNIAGHYDIVDKNKHLLLLIKYAS
jgi:lipoprotein NlpI